MHKGRCRHHPAPCGSVLLICFVNEVTKMSESICQFMPTKKFGSNIKAINFVYETEFHKLPQPMSHHTYHLCVVTEGHAILKLLGQKYELNIGSMFFAFPSVSFEIDADSEYKYIYINFLGDGAISLINQFGITPQNCVFHNNHSIVELWHESIKRINHGNSNILTESCLFFALSYLHETNPLPDKKDEYSFDGILEYINNNFNDSDLSIKKLAKLFSYSENYLSNLFKKTMNERFNLYLNKIRIEHAFYLIQNGETSVAKISEMCGFADVSYFSKVYKRIKGITPAQEIKKIQNKQKPNGS